MQIEHHSFPDDRYYWLRDDMWCALEADGLLRVGITAFGLHLSGDIHMCRPKAAGNFVEQGRTMGVVELSKSVVTIKSPASGEIVAVNERLEDEPGLIQADCYGEGWLVRLRPSRWEEDLQALAHGGGLAAAMLGRIRLEPAT